MSDEIVVEVLADPCNPATGLSQVRVIVHLVGGAVALIEDSDDAVHSGTTARLELGSGSYTWEASGPLGFSFIGPDSDSFVLGPCAVAQLVNSPRSQLMTR